MADWGEYMTLDDRVSDGQFSRKNGRDAPWRYATVGRRNDSWGCGGTFGPSVYPIDFPALWHLLKPLG